MERQRNDSASITFANDENEVPPERIERQRSMLEDFLSQTFDHLADDFSVVDEFSAQVSDSNELSDPPSLDQMISEQNTSNRRKLGERRRSDRQEGLRQPTL